MVRRNFVICTPFIIVNFTLLPILAWARKHPKHGLHQSTDPLIVGFCCVSSKDDALSIHDCSNKARLVCTFRMLIVPTETSSAGVVVVRVLVLTETMMLAKGLLLTQHD